MSEAHMGKFSEDPFLWKAHGTMPHKWHYEQTKPVDDCPVKSKVKAPDG